MASNGWVGCDLDGTLSYYDVWKGPGHIGPPIPRMIERIKKHLEDGDEVRIVTARASDGDHYRLSTFLVAISQWCLEHLGQVLEVTDRKDFRMICLYDDRAIQIIPNTGLRVDGVVDVAFPVAQQDIVPTANVISREIGRLRERIDGLESLRRGVMDECSHPEEERYFGSPGFSGYESWMCYVCEANFLDPPKESA